ncbi:MAG TPA: tRNA uridine-5-carboxymethylaminomethyl(34) synthesis GTPase MnmE [Sulfurospirillum arcachonense]|nr:tRNA uridine-5-carboxymethylaminomethyl(34) synthesis GTPase MnmE [Sulfurospirillum arcachonense]HIP44401.1 tRNA uridine-5-carboxymethylaminomethyl(34) synthesis GTPase MnmE [Sulfurospirillum arcachonense]
MDTIAAIATSHGVGSIAVIRLSGPASLSIAKKLSKKDNFTPRHATLTSLFDTSDDLIDESLVIYFQAPRSFTAEDVIEFQCHGGKVVADMILTEVLKHGARLADPGEFSKRAFLNGRIDLTEAEAIAKLIETKSIDAAKILTRQMKGEVKEFVESVRENLVEVLAFVEVNIDYAEEDLPQDLMDQIKNKLDDLRVELKKTYESSKRREGLINGFKVAIVGKPNVGKSSLLNSLLNYERAIISDIAGTTRDTIEEEIRIGTHLIKIVDTAGIREANDVIEKIGIERSKMAIEESDIVIAMFDNSREFDDEDAQIIDMLNTYNEKDILHIINKSDLDSKLDFSSLHVDALKLNCFEQADNIALEIEKILDKSSLDDSLLLSSKRQMEAVKTTYESIEASTDLLSEGELELFAFHLNEAIMSISAISRNFDRVEILDKMFGSFCLGK